MLHLLSNTITGQSLNREQYRVHRKYVNIVNGYLMNIKDWMGGKWTLDWTGQESAGEYIKVPLLIYTEWSVFVYLMNIE